MKSDLSRSVASTARPSSPLPDHLKPFHLVRRFFGVLFARPLDSEELAWVSSRLTPELWTLFTGQQIADQRHGLQAGRRVAESGREELVAAALLHDVGKTHSRLGPIGRSAATILMFLRLPMTERMTRYRDHGKLGASDLAAAGAPEVAVAFARHHQFGRPPDMDFETWNVLHRADLGS